VAAARVDGATMRGWASSRATRVPKLERKARATGLTGLVQEH